MAGRGIVETDTLVVGSGMAGGAVARALRSAGHTDLAVVSTGSLAGPVTGGSGWRSDNAHYRPVPGVGGRIGGRSALWFGVVLPIHDGVLRAWPAGVASALPAAYRRVLRRLEAWKGRSLDAPTCPADDLAARKLAGEEGGFRTVPVAAAWTPGPDGPRWTAYSPTVELLAGDPPVTLLDGHRVGWFDVAPDGRLDAVARHETTGAPLTVRARRVVLAAGTLESTRLYAQALDRLAGRRTTAWPRLATKIKHGVVTRPAPWMADGLAAGEMVYLVSEQPALRGNLFLEVRPDPRGGSYLELWWLAEQTPGETAVVHLDPGRRIWPGRVACELGPADRELTAARDAHADHLLRGWGCPAPDRHAARFPSAAAARDGFVGEPVRYRNALGLSDHESGTVALGRHLDDRFAGPDLPGLYVAGPATFPRSGAANPSLTIMALAEVLAGRLTGR